MTANFQAFEIPHSLESEQWVVGASLLERQIPHVAKELATTDFYNHIMRSVWSAMLELETDGQDIEPVAVYEIFKRNAPTLAQNYSVAELGSTVQGIPRGFNPALYVEKIQTCAARRQKLKELQNEIQAVATGKNDGSLIIKRNSFRSLSEIIEQETLPALDDLRQGITNRISTGFEAIDRVIGGGLSPSDVLLIAALTGSGKSALALQLAVGIAKQNVPVGFLSGEMSDRENSLRLVSQAAKFFNLNAATYLYEDQYVFLKQWAEALKPLPIYFDAKSTDLQTIAKNIRSLVKECGIKVLFIDYIQLLKLNRFDRLSRFERISECSQEVKRIALELEIAVVEVAQFNREGAKSGKPKLHDLDGASQLEKDISLCFILDREENSDQITLRIEKGRNTGKCEIGGKFTGMNLNFEF